MSNITKQQQADLAVDAYNFRAVPKFAVCPLSIFKSTISIIMKVV